MKKNLILTYLVIYLFFILFSSCEEDTITSNLSTLFVKGYDSIESSECMTLSTLSYVNENNPSYIRDSLIIQLSNVNYATQGKWKLDWGPGLNSDFSNLMFVVKDTTTNPDRYAIAIRGTDWCYFMNWKEDLGAIDFASYPYGETGDSVAYGALVGLNYLLAMRDPVSGQTIVSYLNSIESDENQMYITGHSLGGQLATIFSSWFLDNGYASKFNLKTYTFAAPSTGNEAYKEHYERIFMAANAESYRIVNSKDLVPNFCATLNDIIIQQIPTEVPLLVSTVVLSLEVYLTTYDMIYKNVGVKHDLGTLTPPDCNYPPGTVEQYVCWVAFEHNTNTYLTLLNAPPVNFYVASCDWEVNH